MPPSFLHFNRGVCSNTLFSDTSALTSSLFFRANSTRKGSQTPRLVERFWVPILGASCSNKLRYCPKGVFGKGVGNSKNASEMRQKCVRDASKWVLFYWEKRNVQNTSEIRVKPNLGCYPPLGWAREIRLDPADPS